jgi:hypothetical protein
MYGDFDYMEKPLDNTVQEYTKFENSVYYPIIENLKNGEHIPEDVFNIIQIELNDADGDESKQKEILSDVLNDLPDSETTDNIRNFLNGTTEITEDNFDESSLSLDAKKAGISFDENIGSLDLLIANNYISLPNEK